MRGAVISIQLKTTTAHGAASSSIAPRFLRKKSCRIEAHSVSKTPLVI
jgi:hypothetical protein